MAVAKPAPPIVVPAHVCAVLVLVVLHTLLAALAGSATNALIVPPKSVKA